jgi:hypothetical protein
VGSALGERPSPSRCYTRAVNGTSTAPNGTIGMPSRAAHHHIDLAAAAAGADQPLAPIEHGGIGAIPGSHLGGIGLDLRPREPKSRMIPPMGQQTSYLGSPHRGFFVSGRQSNFAPA